MKKLILSMTAIAVLPILLMGFACGGGGGGGEATGPDILLSANDGTQGSNDYEPWSFDGDTFTLIKDLRPGALHRSLRALPSSTASTISAPMLTTGQGSCGSPTSLPWAPPL